MADIPDREIEDSPLAGSVTRDGVTVQVHIYRFAGTNDAWTLEVVDHESGHTAWDQAFADDHVAYDAFEEAVARHGIRSLVDEPALHRPSTRRRRAT